MMVTYSIKADLLFMATKKDRIKYIINLINVGVDAGTSGWAEYWYVPAYLYDEGASLFKDYYPHGDQRTSYNLYSKLSFFIGENSEIFSYYKLASHGVVFSYQGKDVCFVSDDGYREAVGFLQK